MEKVFAIAQVTIRESFRRKDPYVLLILTFLIVLGAGLFSRFGTEGLGKFVKDVGFSVTNALAIIICVVTAARQLPAEIQNRTLYPLMAKPVSRLQVILGKYLGVSLMASAVVLLFSAELYGLFRFLNIPVSATFLQAVYLRLLSVWLIAAFVIFLSLVVTHAANVTISLLLSIAMSTFNNAILTVMTELEGTSRKVFEYAYFLLPHMELFDLSKKEVHGWTPVPLWVLGAMTVYAALYASIFLGLGIRRFSRLAL
jgi:ABC-type transport system involved in multi-copper enzyme maturation permease subunit